MICPTQPTAIVPLSSGDACQLEGDWPDRRLTRVPRAELHRYAPQGQAKGRALVIAGGGYLQFMLDKEGAEIAAWLNGLGLEAWVLVHRLPGQPRAEGGVHPSDIALQDGLAALDYLATLTPALPLLHVGLSSGGHLAGVLACQPHPPGLRPCGVLMAYAPLNANHRDHKAPAGKPDFAPPEKQAFYDAWPIGIATQPQGLPRVPAFLVFALHDPIVPLDHALNFLHAARVHGLDCEAHIYSRAEHGFALRQLGGTHGMWPELAERWMARCLEEASP